jgi:hypothetical protein
MDLSYEEFKLDKINVESLSDEQLEKWNKLLIKLDSLNKQAERNIKPTNCPLCGKKITSLCKSHSLPAFVLRIIAENGYVKSSKELLEIDPRKSKTGIKQAGVFYSICRECDSRYFQDYENSENLKSDFTPLMMAEIAMKCSLFYLHKRNKEKALLSLYRENNIPSILDENITDIDYNEYIEDFRYDKRQITKNLNGYSLGYYQVLPYVTPIACQIPIAMTIDLNNCLINDVLHRDPSYKIENCIICIYPLEEQTIVALFSRNKSKRYRRFFKELKKLDLATALEKINYLIFKYSEDYFLSRILDKKCLDSLSTVAAESGIFATLNNISHQQLYIDNYCFTKSNQIPNILDEKYALKKEA